MLGLPRCRPALLIDSVGTGSRGRDGDCLSVLREELVHVTAGGYVICLTNRTRERSRASETIRPTLETVHFTTPFRSAWPLAILHFENLDDAV